MSASLWTSAANNIVFSGEALRQPPVINYILKGYHSLALQVGDIVEGKVTGIKPFGAFVSLPEGKTGLVHISEVSYEFVQDLSAVLSDGQTVSFHRTGRQDRLVHQAHPARTGTRTAPAAR